MYSHYSILPKWTQLDKIKINCVQIGQDIHTLSNPTKYLRCFLGKNPKKSNFYWGLGDL